MVMAIMKISNGPRIVSRPCKENATTLITGAAGLLGSHIAVELLKKGQRIAVLLRKKGAFSAVVRFQSICEFLGLGKEAVSNVRVFEGSLDKPYFGLGESAYDELCMITERIIHAAANTAFSDRQRVESIRDNVTSLNALLTCAHQSRASWFHLISTVYVNSSKEEICEEKLNDTGSFNNIYEETKSKGEYSTLRFCHENGIGATILRPSIVIGNSENGRTFRFNGLYYPLKALILIRNLLYADLHSGLGQRAERLSISSDNGKVHMPLRLEFGSREGLNIIPVDYLSKVARIIFEKPLDGCIYHITAKNNTSIRQIIDYTQLFFNICGITTVENGFFSHHPKTTLERLFDSYIEPYIPYMKDKRTFLMSNTDNALKYEGITCPPFDYNMFSRCMQFAVRNNWGKALRAKIL